MDGTRKRRGLAGTGEDAEKRVKLEEHATVDHNVAGSEPGPSEVAVHATSITCDVCAKDLKSTVHIKCAICDNFDVCLECFSQGKTTGDHKPSHAYHVMDVASYPLFEASWGGDEELLLLDAIETYGFGNWADIAEHVGSKTAQQCETHYFNTYINVPTAPLPDMSRMLDTPVVKDTSPMEEDAGTKGGIDAAPLPESLTMVESAGYMPLRGDFEFEWDNDAEGLVKDVVFQDDDTPLDRELKLAMIDMYNQVLDERENNKKFVIEHGLLEPKRLQALDRRRSKEDKELRDKLQPFARLFSAAEFEKIYQGFVAENRLRARIRQLQHYRSQGITTLKEAELYEAELVKREAAKVRKRNGVAYSQSSSRRRAESVGLESDGTASATSSRAPSRKPVKPLDVSGFEGAELLSPAEIEICSSIRLLPAQYMSIKAALITASTENGGRLKLAQARQAVKIDVNKTRKIFNYLEENGLINTGS